MDRSALRLWMRHEERPSEQRAPVVPRDAGRLVERGVAVTVEESAQRVFPAADYAAVGCRIAEPGSWTDAPDDVYVVGLKELPPGPAALRHQHVFFGHAYKGQPYGQTLLERFVAGGGALLDIEYLVDAAGHRLAAFGYWAGYIGAALAVLHVRGELAAPLQPAAHEALDAVLVRSSTTAATPPGPRALVIGARGRSGRGAVDALRTAGMATTPWDTSHTRRIDRSALLAHDLLVNAVLTSRPVPPFVRTQDVADPTRRLTVISDVTCDVGSEWNVLPIYDAVTTWDEPVRRLHPGPPPLDLIAIDNLPSLLPREASEDFSSQLTPHLFRLGDPSGPWARCGELFDKAVAALR